MPIVLSPLAPAEAIAYFRAKDFAVSFAWQDIWQEEHAKAFTVAKAMSLDLLTDIRGAVDQALTAGTTFDEFRKQLKPTLQAKGWWGRQAMEDPQTGEIKDVQLGSTRRLRTIFDVNLRTAYQAGKWERIQRTKSTLPFLRYVAVNDSRTRPEHRAWSGTVLPATDPWWQTHYPPCGWRCRCQVQQFSQTMLDRRGYEVTDQPVKFPPKVYKNPRTGEVITMERGIDPGWNYNVGEAHLAGVTPNPLPPAGEGRTASSSNNRLARLESRGGVDLLDAGVSADEAIAAFLGALGVAPGQERVVNDADGWPLAVSDAWFRNAARRRVVDTGPRRRVLGLVGQTLAHPGEIRAAWRTGLDGTAYLVRRYVAAYGALTVAVDVGSGIWTFTSSAEADFNPAMLREGSVIWRRTAAA